VTVAAFRQLPSFILLVCALGAVAAGLWGI